MDINRITAVLIHLDLAADVVARLDVGPNEGVTGAMFEAMHTMDVLDALRHLGNARAALLGGGR